MFQIGFWELVVVGLVALIVLGPDKLPTIARLAGRWLMRGRQLWATVKTDWQAAVNSSSAIEKNSDPK